MTRRNKGGDHIRVRPYSHGIDYGPLVEGLRANDSFREGEDTPERYRTISSRAISGVLVADLGKLAVAGSVQIGIDDRVGLIQRLNVRPESQGQGVGTALMKGAVRRLLDKGVTPELLVEIEPEAAPANRLEEFYSRMGFASIYRAVGMAFEGMYPQDEQPKYPLPEREKVMREAFSSIHDTLMQWPPPDDFFLETQELNQLLQSQRIARSMQIQSWYDYTIPLYYTHMHAGHFHDDKETKMGPIVRVWTSLETQMPKRHQLLHLAEIPWGSRGLNFNKIGGLYIARHLDTGELESFFVTEKAQTMPATIRPASTSDHDFIVEQLLKGADYLGDTFRDSRWNTYF